MKIAAIVSFVALALAAAAGHAQALAPAQNQKPGQAVSLTQDPHFHLMYANPDIQVFDLVLLPHQSTLLDQHNDDSLFVSFGQSTVTLQNSGLMPVQLNLPDGAVRFATGGFTRTLTNDGDRPFHDLTIVFLNEKLTGRGCSCNGGPAAAICDCPNAPPLAADWSRRIGQILLRGVTLAPGATYDDDSTRTTRFLVSVTPFDIMDVSIHEPKNLEVRLPEGRFHWLAPGPHKIQNLSPQPMRFVSVEFYGTVKKED
jgi:hypothetical protein